MKRGERVRLIQETTGALTSLPSADLQLTLRQFGLETFDFEYDFRNSMEPTDYCYLVLGDAADETLREIHTFTLGHHALAPDVADWAELPVRVFISHTYANRHLVGQVKTYLEGSYGCAAFVAHDDIVPSRQWRVAIRAALNAADLLAAIVFEGFHESQWCDQEVGWALGRGIPVVPFRPRGFDRASAKDGFIEEHQDALLDANHVGGDDARWIADRIFHSLARHPATRPLETAAAVEALVSSSSYDATRRLWKIIQTSPSGLNSDQLRRLEYAVTTNSQVYDAVYDARPIPELVKELVTQLEPPLDADPWGSDAGKISPPPF